MSALPRLVLAIAFLGSLALGAETAAPPVTGPFLPGLDHADATMLALMEKYECPGAQLAVTYRGRLVLARGYGFADRDTHSPVRPESLFRLASLSKLITSTAILTLVEQHKLRLDDPAFTLLPQFRPLPGAKTDPRLATITVRQLLHHTGGWDRGASGDPMFKSAVIAAATGTRPPASAEAIIRYMLGQPLDFDPGSKFVYSNFGYNVLGRLIETISGQSYSAYVQAHVFAPAGIRQMRLGHSRAADRAPGEVTYYGFAGETSARSVFAAPGSPVSPPYGAFNLEAMDSHGGWLGNTIDYVRLIAALDGMRPPALLTPASLVELTARPAPPVSVNAPVYYGAGIDIRPVRGSAPTGANWWHGGALPGTITYQVRRADGWSWAAFFNSRPRDSGAFSSEIDRSVNASLTKIPPPQSGDLFEKFTSPP